MYNTAKDPRKKSWRGKTTYKDDIFVVFTIEKLSTYYVVGRTWLLASNRPGCKTWCLHLVARWPWQVAKESRSPQEWQGAKHHPAQLWELSDLYESGEQGSCHPRHLPPDRDSTDLRLDLSTCVLKSFLNESFHGWRKEMWTIRCLAHVGTW